MAEPEQRPETAAETVPLEAHIVALRAELERTRAVQQLATGALVAVALLLLWQAIREARP